MIRQKTILCTMIKLHSVGLTNYSVYKHVDFVIPKGVSIIRGKNASGKSLIGHVLPLVFWEHPVAKKVRSAGTAHVKLVSDNKYSISKTLNKVKYKIIKNKKDLQTTTIKESEKHLKQALPITPEYFWNCVYLSSARPCPIQYSSPTERLVHFQNLFNLNIYEVIHARLKEMLRTKKANKVQFDLLEREKAAVNSQVERIPQSKIDKLTERNRVLTDKVAKIDKQLILNKQYDSIKACMELDFDIDTTNQLLAKIDKKLNMLKKAQRDYHNKAAQYQKYQESLKYKDALDVDILKELSVTFNEFELKLLIDSIKYCKKHKHNKHKYVKTLNNKDHYYEKLVQAKQLQQRVKLLDGKTECPTCGTELCGAHMLNEHFNCQDDIKKYSELWNIAKEAEQYFKHRDRVVCSEQAFKYLVDFIDEELERARQAKRYTDVEHCDEPEQVDEDKIRQLSDKRDRLIKHKSHLEQLVGLKKVKIDVDVDELREQQANTFTKLTSYNIKNEAYKNASERIKELNNSLAELDVSDIQLLELLYEAYGNKGIKSKQIDVILDLYCKKLNEFAPLLYSDKVHFSYKVDNNKCELFCTRNGQIGEVSTFSGFETRAFQLSSMLALVSILGIKLDTLFIDEMENGMDEHHLQRFTHRFLPQLQRYIPKIVVITPRSLKELYVQDAHEFKVVKKGKTSTLNKLGEHNGSNRPKQKS